MEHGREQVTPGRAFPVKAGVMPAGLFKGERTSTLTRKNCAVEF